jgi:AAA15 family ATPase/GTPase
MIESLEVKNFRCFKDLHLSDLRRINVVVGDSGSGKTALLEALWICAGMGPEFFFALGVGREG